MHRELANGNDEIGRERRAPALIGDERHRASAARSRSTVLTMFPPEAPHSHDVRTIVAASPAASSPASFDLPYTESGLGSSSSRYGAIERAVEDVVGAHLNQVGAGAVARCAQPSHGVGVVAKCLARDRSRSVDRGPRGGVDDDVGMVRLDRLDTARGRRRRAASGRGRRPCRRRPHSGGRALGRAAHRRP